MKTQMLSPNHQTLLLELGQTQIDKLFKWNSERGMDDSEFLPLMDVIIETFKESGLFQEGMRNLRTHVIRCYHEACIEAEPASAFADNKNLMLSHLSPKKRKVWEQPKESA